jgi:acetyl esterase/lipase
MSGTIVVYVHGLWLNGWESALLRRRLSRFLDCRAVSFAYSSVREGLAQNARALAAFVGGIEADTLHLVGHSMGGLLILALFEAGYCLPPGRVVFLGSPVRGSRAARNLAEWPCGHRLMGITAHEALLPVRVRRWGRHRDLGVIAGSLAVGFGRLTGRFDEPSDGTVLVSETHIEGAKQHLTLHTTHSGMVYSPVVARHTATFLRDGRFPPRS